MFELRPYQQDAKDAVLAAWASGVRNALVVLPTGAGKTVTFADVIHGNHGPVCAVAHRQELVSQMSLALARDGVVHSIIGPPEVIKLCTQQNLRETGASCYQATAPVAVAGVDTLIRRTKKLAHWSNRVTLWVMDEAHHVLADNKWGKAVDMFPHARGLGVTATPMRADGAGLGKHADGVFETMHVGPSMRDLIADGFLTDYRIFAPAGDLHREDLKIGSTGDFTRDSLKTAIKKSHIVGDVVEHYKRIAAGKLGITFCTDIETATETAEAYNVAGVPAAVVSSKTPDRERVTVLRRFKKRELLQLVNVDIFGEGFDLPAIEVVSMARPTESYGLYVQQFGRALRLMDGKVAALIIDHVGNVVRHGLPDAPRTWTLNRVDRKSRGASDEIPLSACPDCTGVYERVLTVCPYCGYKPEPAERSTPEQVDGDLAELSPEVLEQMRAAVEHVDMDSAEYRQHLIEKGCPQVGVGANLKRHREQQEAQQGLRDAIATWAGVQNSLGRVGSERYKRFYFKFGTDVLSAQALKTKDAQDLADRVRESMA